MTVKEIFNELWSIKDRNARAERMDKLVEQDANVAARIKTLLRYSDQFQSVLDNPLIFLSSSDVEDQTARYSVTSELARGGMGVIYAAYDSQMRRDVVLKCLQLKHRNNFQAVQRFYNEAHITGQLQHPGIAPVYELGELDDGRPFFCMKLVQGKTLTQILAQRDSPAADKRRLLNIFLQTCQTLAFAHERGIIHRDLKPSNIMVGKHGQTQVMDWGVAKDLFASDENHENKSVQSNQGNKADVSREFDFHSSEKANPDLTRHGQIVGTPGYMAPEQAMAQTQRIGKHSDVYALGAILCEILTGTPPYRKRMHTAEENSADSKDCIQRLSESDTDIELIELAQSCLQKDPAERPQDASVVAQCIATYLESKEANARATEIRLEKELTRNEEARKRRFWGYVSAAVCVGLLVFGIVGTSTGFYRESIARKDAVQNAKDERIAKDAAENARQAANDAKEKAEARLTQLKKGNEILGSVFENLHPSQRSGKPLVDLLVGNLDKATEQLEGNSIGAPDVVASFQTRIGRCYHALGFDEKAIPLFEKALDFTLAEHGIENKITRSAQYRLANSLVLNHQAERANRLYLELQQFYINSEQTDSPEFFRFQCKLASNCLAMGERKKALELIEAYSERGLEVIGIPYGLHMAEVYTFNNKPKKTIEVVNSLLAKMDSNETNVGGNKKTDFHREGAQVFLARSHLQLNQPRKAIQILEELFPVFESRYGNSPNAGFYMVSFTLGKALQGVGRYRDSIKHLEKSVSLTEAESGSLQKQKIYALYWLVEAFIKTGDSSKALEAANRIHNQQLAKNGTGNLATSLSAERLADIYLLMNQQEKAKEYLDNAFANYGRRKAMPRLLEARKEFKLAMVTANQGELVLASEKFKKSIELLRDVDESRSNYYPIFFDILEPQIWHAETLALLGDEDAIGLIEEFESKIRKRRASLDELIVPAQRLYRACIARYLVKPDETLIVRLKEVIELLKKERLEGTQAHLLEEARSLLGMAYLKLGKTTEAKGLLESSFSSLRSIENPPQQISQATIDAGMRLSHFYSITNANDEAQRVSDSIKTIESNTDHIPSFNRALIDKTLTTDSK